MTKEAEIIEKQIQKIISLKDDEFFPFLKELRESAHPEVIPALIERWQRAQNDDIRQEIFSFLVDIKNQDSLQQIFNAIIDEKYREQRIELLSILWQSSLDASHYIDELVELAIRGDYLTIIEVSTIVENLDNSFNEDHVLDMNYNIQEVLYEESNQDRRVILQNLAKIISKLPLQ